MLIIIRNIISKKGFIFSVVILLPLLIIFIKNDQLKDSEKTQLLEIKQLVELATQLNKRWEQGDNSGDIASGKLNCEALEQLPKDTASEFYQCNHLYFHCFLTNIFDDRDYKFHGFKNRARDVIVDLKHKIQGEIVHLKFEKHCHEKFLPANTYMASALISDEYKWDNHLYNIFVDKYYATNLNMPYQAQQNLISPLRDLSLEQMQSYCQQQGKILLEERYLDAASFYPDNKNAIYKHPFPWTKSHESFLVNQDELTESDCFNAFVRGCEKFFSFQNYLSLGASWMGINHTLGSLPEFVTGTFQARGNLKVSSHFIRRDSQWHRLGMRGFMGKNEIEMIEQYSDKLIPEETIKDGVSFRCARLQ